MMELNKVSNKELIDLAVTAMKVAEEAKPLWKSTKQRSRAGAWRY